MIPDTMQQYTPAKANFFYVIALCLTIAGCGSTSGTKELESDIFQLDSTAIDDTLNYNWINIEAAQKEDALTALIPQIRSAFSLSSPDKDSSLLELASQIKALDDLDIEDERKSNWLYNTLLGIDPAQLDDPQFVSYLDLARDSFAAKENPGLLYRLLNNPRINQVIDQLSVESQIKTHSLSAQVFGTQGDIIPALRQLMALQALLTDPAQVAENHERIWLALGKLEAATLADLAELEFDGTLAGWYRLAAAYKQQAGNIEAVYQATNSWRLQHPGHPAAENLPIDLELIQLLLRENPRHIAMLLPLTGKLSAVGKAIRDGFFSAYYSLDNEQNLSTNKAEVSFFDTNNNDVIELYELAIDRGADLVIGPLDKTNVSILENHTLSVPTIALNYTHAHDAPINPQNTYLYQFGLSLEDEARQVARHAFDREKKYAMVIAADDDWSYRTAEAFNREWTRLGGVIVARNSFSKKDDLSKSTKQILNVATSEGRARKLGQLFGENLEFEPRRRSDIDMIFLVARSKVAQQLKPILAFHYAGDVPVFATSQLFSSTEDESKNRDLSGITISTLPWVVDEGTLKSKLVNTISVSPNLERLYALGADIWLLHNRLPLLNWSGEQSLQGNTGQLFLAKNKRIYRKQPFAEIIKGKAELIPELPLIEAAQVPGEITDPPDVVPVR